MWLSQIIDLHLFVKNLCFNAFFLPETQEARKSDFPDRENASLKKAMRFIVYYSRNELEHEIILYEEVPYFKKSSKKGILHSIL